MEEYDKVEVEALIRHFKDVLKKKSLNPIIDLSKKCTPDDRQRTYKHTEHFKQSISLRT